MSSRMGDPVPGGRKRSGISAIRNPHSRSSCILCCLLLSASPLHAAVRVLPDELTLDVGDIDEDGEAETIVLRKRSVRSERYLFGTWSEADGFRKMEPFPVSTYRGYVKGDRAMRVNASIEPGGLLNANFSEGSAIVATVTERKIGVGAGKGTRVMSAGNKVIPLRKTRVTPTPGGYMVPPQPMRRVKFAVEVASAYVDEVGGDLEKVVSQIEQRFNDGDFVYARDIGVAWEVTLIVIRLDASKKAMPWQEFWDADPRMRFNSHGYFGGSSCGNAMRAPHIFTEATPPWNHPFWIRGSNVRAASTLLHEVGHQFYGGHHLDKGDCLFGCHAFVGPTHVQIMLRHCEGATEETSPAVLYSDALPPFALADFANTRKDTPVAVDVLDNDYDGNGDTISLQGAGPKSDKGGRVALSEGRKKVVYTPPPGFVGQDRFTYAIVDSTGIANRTGKVKVDVRIDGLASHFSFETAEREEVPWRRGKKVVWHFAGRGPHGGRSTTDWIKYVPVGGVRGNGILNPVGCHRFGHVRLPGTGDPGRWSLSVSLWVLYPEAPSAPGVIVCKGAFPNARRVGDAVNGWGIAHLGGGKGFTFAGNIARMRPEDNFDLSSEEPVAANTWYHLVMVMDRERKKLRAWVNSREVLTSRTRPDIPDGVIEHYTPVHLFNSFVWKKWNSSPALIDELRIYTSALAPEQVAELYAEGR
ncbi:MAG: Ig-like domain-containing protein, partial [Planctomycetota bacterium]